MFIMFVLFLRLFRMWVFDWSFLKWKYYVNFSNEIENIFLVIVFFLLEEEVMLVGVFLYGVLVLRFVFFFR